MVKSLNAKNIKALNLTDLDQNPEFINQTFDLIICLNVLDRCGSPLSLLKNIRNLIEKNKCPALISVVFPFCPYVEKGKITEYIEVPKNIPQDE